MIAPVARTERPDADAGAAELRGSPPRVLLAEDDEYIRLLCSLTLGRAGFAVTEVVDGIAALEQARLVPPELLLCDVRIPRLDGFALAAALQLDERTGSIPIVFVSGDVRPATRQHAFDLGAAGFLVKPFEPGELAGLLAHVVVQMRGPLPALGVDPPRLRGGGQEPAPAILT